MNCFRSHRFFAGVLALVFTACGGEDTQDPTSPAQPVVATVEVTPAEQYFNAIGATQQFNAVARTASSEIVSGQPVDWSSSDNGVATVTTGGLVTATGNGTATITASAGSVSDTASITVQQEISEVTLSADSLVLDRWGDSAQVGITVLDSGGTAVVGTSVTWSTSDPNVADIDQEGVITTWLEGAAEIAAEVAVTGGALPAGGTSPTSPAMTLQATVTLPVRVALQRNVLCQVPTTFPVKPTVGALPTWQQEVDPLGGTDPGSAFWTASGAIAGDFDGDGDDDAIVPAHPAPPPASDIPNEGQLLFWRNVGGTPPLEYATAPVLEPDSIRMESSPFNELADFNSDGVVDVFRAQIGFDAEPFPGAPNLLLLSQPDGTMLDVSATHLVPNESDRMTETAVASDIDCDGDSDLFTANINTITTGPLAHLYVNDGTGLLSADDLRLPAEIADGRLAIIKGAACDLDRDGDEDLFLGRYGSLNPEFDQEIVLANDGFGRFRRIEATLPPSHYGDVNVPLSVACGDLDLDGLPDVVMSSNGGGADVHLNVLMNRGDMEFEEAMVFNQRSGATSNEAEALVDLNGDGWLDIARKSLFPQDALLINAGGAGFTATSLPPPTAEVSYLDVDGDGKLDVLYPIVESFCDCFQPLLWYQR